MHDCLNAIRADADRPCGDPVPWRECLPHTLPDSRSPALVAYREDWARADARDEACVRANAWALRFCTARAASALLERCERSARIKRLPKSLCVTT